MGRPPDRAKHIVFDPHRVYEQGDWVRERHTFTEEKTGKVKSRDFIRIDAEGVPIYVYTVEYDSGKIKKWFGDEIMPY